MITSKIARKLITLSQTPVSTFKQLDELLRNNFKGGSINAIIDVKDKNGFAKKVSKKLKECGFKTWSSENRDGIVEMDIEL